LDILLPILTVSVIFFAVHCFCGIKLFPRSIAQYIKSRPSAVISGAVSLLYFCIMALTLLGPIGPGQAAQPRLVPLQTIVAMTKDIVKNGFLDLDALSNWGGSLLNGVYIISHSTRNLVANVVLFVPIGLLLAWHVKRIKLTGAAIISVAIPIAVELWQLLLCRGRTCDVDDVILNFIGIFFGFAVVIIYRNRRKNGKRNNRRNKQIDSKEARGA